MLRRPPTTLTLTPTDIAAYEVSRAQRLAQAAADAKRKQKQKLKERQRQEQDSPARGSIHDAPSKTRQTGVPMRGGSGAQSSRAAISGADDRQRQRQRQAQAQRIFGREAGSVGPAIDDEEDDDDDEQEDYDVTFPPRVESGMRGGSYASPTARARATSQQEQRVPFNTATQPSDTETNTETDTDDNEDMAMDAEPSGLRHYHGPDDDDPGGSGGWNDGHAARSAVQPNSHTTSGGGPSSASTNYNTSSTSGRTANTRTRQGTPQVESPSSLIPVSSKLRNQEIHTSLPSSGHEPFHAQKATESIHNSQARPAQSKSRRSKATATVDPRNKRPVVAALPRRQGA